MPRKLNVLLADDDETFALLVQKALEQIPEAASSCSLNVVTDGSDAVDYVAGSAPYDDRETYPAPDVVLLDQRMRRMDGTEALRRLKEDPRTLSVPVCLLSTSDEPKLKSACYGYGATCHITKPLEFVHLKRKLELLVRFFTDVLDVTEGCQVPCCGPNCS